MTKSIQEMADSGEVRVSEVVILYERTGLSAEEIRAAQERKYAGAVILRPDEPLPSQAGADCWAERLYTPERPTESVVDRSSGKLVYSPPPFWLVIWTTPEVEAAFRAGQRGASEVGLDTFHAMRSSGIEERG